MTKKNLGFLIGAAAILAAGAWHFTRSDAQSTAKSGALPPTVVNLAQAVRQDVPVVEQANGNVVPRSTVDLHPQTTATIRSVHIKEGQFVKTGELMFSLDDRSDRANVDKAQAQVVRDQAALADTERQYKRSQELYDQKFIAQSAVDTLKSQVDGARALLNADIAAAQSSKVSASFTEIRAPMAGRVGAIGVYPGSLVQPATSLTSITQIDPIDVAFTLPEASLSALMAAYQKGRIVVEASVKDGDKPVQGTLSFIDNTVDPQAGTIRVKAQFDNRDAALWPGQYVTARVTVRTLKDAVVIPQNAIISNTRGTFVYTMEHDQSVKQHAVSRVYAFGASAAVTGLVGGEKVVVEGKQNLRPDSKVVPAKNNDAQMDAPK